MLFLRKKYSLCMSLLLSSLLPSKGLDSNLEIWSFNPTPGRIFGEEHGPKGCMHPNVHCSTVCNNQGMEATYMPIDEWIKKMWEILLSHWKEWNNAICRNMDGPRDCHTGWSKSGRKSQVSYITYMQNLKKKKWYKWTYLQNRNRLTNLENKGILTKGAGWWRERELRSLGLTCTHCYI